ncbi:MAG: hypothetical protein ABIO36_02120 [Pyrinomonadaceae bacterium]
MYFIKITIVASVFVLLTFISVRDVFACECWARDVQATVPEAFERAQNVITVTVVSISEPEYFLDRQSIKMRVEKVYKGEVNAGDILTFGQAGGKDCLWYFTKESVGKSYLFYLGKPTKARPYKTNAEIEKSDAEAKYYVSTCGRSAAMEQAGNDISYLDKIK